MGRFIIAAAILLSSSTGFAQVPAPSIGSAMDSSGLTAMGDTSAPPPPGASAAAAALDGAGVPLGATDLFVGGLSPSPTDLGGGCPSALGVVTLGTGAIFSGNGTLSMSPSDLGGATTPSDSDCSTRADGRSRTVGTVVDHWRRGRLRRREHSARGDRAFRPPDWRARSPCPGALRPAPPRALRVLAASPLAEPHARPRPVDWNAVDRNADRARMLRRPPGRRRSDADNRPPACQTAGGRVDWSHRQ